MSMQQVIKDMAHLNSREKATIAHCLIASLDTEQDEETNQAWDDLAMKRFAELVSGDIESVSWDSIRKEVKG